MVILTLKAKRVLGTGGGERKAQAYRDTRGPGLDAYKALLAVAQAQPGTKGLRDVALLRLLPDLGLRRGEAVRLNATSPATVSWCSTLEAWLQARGAEDGPLFVNFNRAGKGGRLTASGVYFIVRELGTLPDSFLCA